MNDKRAKVHTLLILIGVPLTMGLVLSILGDNIKSVLVSFMIFLGYALGSEAIWNKKFTIKFRLAFALVYPLCFSVSWAMFPEQQPTINAGIMPLAGLFGFSISRVVQHVWRDQT